MADRGLISEDNLALVAAHGFDHVLATRLHHDDVAAVLEQASGPSTAWTALPEANSFCAEITHDSRRFVVVFSPVRYFRDRSRHRALCARIEDGLIALEQRVRSGRLTDPAKIGAAADRVLRSSPVGRCFVVNIKKGFFSGTSTRRHDVTTRSCCAGAMSSRPRSVRPRPRSHRSCVTTGVFCPSSGAFGS